MSIFWTNFTNLCNAKGRSPNNIADAIPVSSGTITNWSNGTEPSPKLLLRVAQYFGVTTNYLLSDHSSENEKSPATNSDGTNEIVKYIIGTVEDFPFEYQLRAANLIQSLKQELLTQETQKGSE